MLLICYDVSFDKKGGPRRLRRIAKLCQDYGQRVQYSVFECIVDPAQWASLKNRLLGEYNEKCDSLRFYYLGKNYKNRVECTGRIKAPEQEEPLIL